MLSALGQAGTGFVLVALSAAMYWRNRFATIRAVLVFLGILLMGGGVATIAARFIGFLMGLLGATVGHWLGVGTEAVVGAIVVILAFVVFHDWAPKNSAKKSTYWMSAVLAVIIVAGLTPFGVLNNLPANLTNGNYSTVSYHGG